MYAFVMLCSLLVLMYRMTVADPTTPIPAGTAHRTGQRSGFTGADGDTDIVSNTDGETGVYAAVGVAVLVDEELIQLE